MNHKHRTTLHALFAHPISGNIAFKDVKSVLEELGADISRGGHSHLAVKLNGHTHNFHDTVHSLSKDAVTELRKFLELAGVDPVKDHPL
jgi:hypothetical protein